MASKRKNSLVNNINRRKRAGKSRAKSKSTVSKEAYRGMQQGWPSSRKKKATKKRSATQSTSKRKTTRSSGARKAAKKK